MLRKLDQVLEEYAAGQATGCRGSGVLGKFYNDSGNELTDDEAQDLLLEGKTVEVPNAGAGSYRSVFERLKFEDVDVYEWSSSAGDWTFVVYDGQAWYPAFQSNRYPHHGFRYSMRTDVAMADKRDLFELLEAME